MLRKNRCMELKLTARSAIFKVFWSYLFLQNQRRGTKVNCTFSYI